MRDEDRVRLLHIVETADALRGFVTGRNESDLESDVQLQFAVTHALEIIGEAASQVSIQMREALPDVPWRAMTAMRNRLAHGYFDIDTAKLWTTATANVPVVPLVRAALGRD